jgi:hypothetical protein
MAPVEIYCLGGRGMIFQSGSGSISVSEWVAPLSRCIPGVQQLLFTGIWTALFGGGCAGPELWFAGESWIC